MSYYIGSIETGKIFLQHYGVLGMRWGITRHRALKEQMNERMGRIGFEKRAMEWGQSPKELAKFEANVGRNIADRDINYFKYKTWKPNARKSFMSDNAIKSYRKADKPLNALDEKTFYTSFTPKQQKHIADKLSKGGSYNKVMRGVYNKKNIERMATKGKAAIGTIIGLSVAGLKIYDMGTGGKGTQAIDKRITNGLNKVINTPAGYSVYTKGQEVKNMIKNTVFHSNVGEDYLQHYGILGMKWGRRKSQKQMRSMSDAELRDKVNRLNLEQQYQRLTTPQKTSAGKTFITQIARDSAKGITTSQLIKRGNAKVDKFINSLLEK